MIFVSINNFTLFSLTNYNINPSGTLEQNAEYLVYLLNQLPMAVSYKVTYSDYPIQHPLLSKQHVQEYIGSNSREKNLLIHFY
jgi:hypothetical protein